MAVADLLPLLVIILAAGSAAADSIHGCGGFVQVSDPGRSGVCR